MSVGMTTGQLQDLLNDVIITWRTNIVTMSESKFQDILKMIETNSKFEAECSNIRSSFFNYYLFQIAGSDREYNC
jgi:hypothetical protein